MRQELTDGALASLGAKTTIAGLSSTYLGVYTSSALFGYAGIAFAFIGIVINWYYKRREDRRKSEEYERLKEDYNRRSAEREAFISYLQSHSGCDRNHD